jgi:hypothetical protein
VQAAIASGTNLVMVEPPGRCSRADDIENDPLVSGFRGCTVDLDPIQSPDG